MLYPLVRSHVKLESGRPCRRCGAPISPRDPFGFAEAVCPGCRD